MGMDSRKSINYIFTMFIYFSKVYPVQNILPKKLHKKPFIKHCVHYINLTVKKTFVPGCSPLPATPIIPNTANNSDLPNCLMMV